MPEAAIPETKGEPSQIVGFCGWSLLCLGTALEKGEVTSGCAEPIYKGTDEDGALWRLCGGYKIVYQ